MLTKLSIKNYALIEDISIDFYKGFTTISGETGAGKSILLGGLGLILGDRADTKTLMNPEKKCVIEGEFYIKNYHLEAFFETHDIDYEPHSIIRRELLPSGKSRAFINDTPVRLEILRRLQHLLIDIHSQHQTLQLQDKDFQLQVVDAFSGNASLLKNYKTTYKKYQQLQDELEKLKIAIAKESEQKDYHRFLYDELQKAGFKDGEQERLESQIEHLNNIELIQNNLSLSFNELTEEEIGILDRISRIKSVLSQIKTYSADYDDLYERVTSLHIELQDIETGLDRLKDFDDLSLSELESLNERLQLLYNLLQKHKVSNIEELLAVQNDLEEKLSKVENATAWLEEKQNALAEIKRQLLQFANDISAKRTQNIPQLEKTLTDILHRLGMPQARFHIHLTQEDHFNKHGIDTLNFLFSANKGNRLAPVKQVASGGELSRIMLAIKSVMAAKTHLPTIIFDEIDTGVSGEIALVMASIMRQMATDMQVISITHLPQIAAKGERQLKVYKETASQHTKTYIKPLDKKERIVEIAEMLGGKTIRKTAINHAKELLN